MFDLDLDFSQPRRKWELQTLAVILFLLFCFSTPILELIQDGSCQYIEYLQTFWYDWLGISEEMMDTLSDKFGFTMSDAFLMAYIFGSNNKYFAMLMVVGIKSKGVTSQVMKTMFQESRPGWTCGNLDDSTYCRMSFGLPATHVWEATVCYLNIIYFGFVHNGYFNRHRNNVWLQILRYTGICICVGLIWFVHQSRLVLAAHYLYQDYYGFLGGCVYFYLLYHYFFPWAMDEGRRFEFRTIWKLVLPIFLLASLIFWTIYFCARWGLDLETEFIELIEDECGYSEDQIRMNFVRFDTCDANYIFASILGLIFLPLKNYLPQGHAWKWSFIGLPLFVASFILVNKLWAQMWLDWSHDLLFIIDSYDYAIWLWFFESIQFLYFVGVHQLFDKPSRVVKQEI